MRFCCADIYINQMDVLCEIYQWIMCVKKEVDIHESTPLFCFRTNLGFDDDIYISLCIILKIYGIIDNYKQNKYSSLGDKIYINMND